MKSGSNMGKRSYAARGYYESNKDRVNLDVSQHARASFRTSSSRPLKSFRRRSTVSVPRRRRPVTEFERKQLEQVITHLESDTPANIQVVVLPTTVNYKAGIQDQSTLFKVPELGEASEIAFAMLLSYPVSRGSIHIKYFSC